jgi:hypothetical protein|tara:strand:+ start:365 stop:514 length:150 start_codon:yes stop_codon:yes gene_type:complete
LVVEEVAEAVAMVAGDLVVLVLVHGLDRVVLELMPLVEVALLAEAVVVV